ncbi:hypothetical protein V5799_012073 [Amblyomma americanum]|uniref:TIR domain-containing protein n=1 Tax=Amblyomma americanum TaxID=6943 RepID=A0AAQ4EFF2_AMBAM
MCLERYDVLGATETELRVIERSISRSSQCNPIYDAFVCYTSKDWPTVEVLVDRLESLGFRLFLPKRDLKAGLFKYPAFYEVMEKWCRKTIIAFSPHFLQSEECRAQQRFIESIHIGESSIMNTSDNTLESVTVMLSSVLKSSEWSPME